MASEPEGATGEDAPLPEHTRRRLDDVFGDVLPEVTRDEVTDRSDASSTSGDEWLRANRPPHHDGA